MSEAPDILQQALDLHRAGRLAEARDAYGRVIATRPDHGTARHCLGVLELSLGNPRAAVAHLDTAARLEPSNAAVIIDLGRALLADGRLEPAGRAFEAALALTGEHPEIRFHLGLVRERQGRRQDAEAQYQQVLIQAPGHTGARFRLARLRMAAGQLADATRRFEEIVDDAPRHWESLVSLATLAEQGQGEHPAEHWLEKAAALDAVPAPDAHLRLSRACEDRGDMVAAEAIARRATRACPGHDIAWRNLGQVLKRMGRIDDAVVAFEEAHRILRAPGSRYGLNRPEFRRTNRAKLRHDVEQLQYLRARGKGPADLDALIAEHRRLLDGLPPDLPEGEVVGLPAGALVEAGGHYNRCMHRAEAPELPEGALAPGLDTDAISADYHARRPGITWIDGFLRPGALNALRDYLLESTIWYDADHPKGYVGAYIHDGFTCPLVLQIARELPALLPGIFGEHALLQLWAYHYDSRLEGIGMHADFAAVNVNFWLTPDDALLDPESGGMVIWDKEAPGDWDFAAYNTDDAGTKARMEGFLESAGAQRIVVPYRQNRVVIFNSDLFHRTGDIRFRDGFENRRINVTMLYGRREQG